MPGPFRLLSAITGLVLTVTAGVLAATTDSSGRGPVLTLAGLDRPYLRLVSVDVEPQQVALAWSGNGERYLVSLGDDLEQPSRTVVTTEPRAILPAPEAADPQGRVSYRVQEVTDDEGGLSLEGTVTLLPKVPAKPRVRETASNGAKLTWKPAAYATTYDVAVSRSRDRLPTRVWRLVKGATTFTTDALKPETTYWVRLRAVGEAGVSEFGPATKIVTPPDKAQFTVGSWNICAEACSGFSGRAGGQASQVHAAGVDVMTLQEAGGKRVGPTTLARFSGGPRGLVPAAGGGNSRYILYAEDTFEQLGGGRWAIGHGRWATWARLKEKETERAFVVVSVHLLSGHHKTGERASEMRTLMGALAGVNPQGDPVVLAGDFNSGTHRKGDTVGPIVRANQYRDTVEVAEETVNAQVNTGSRRGSQAIMSGDHVDHIYVSPDWEVPSWRQWANLSGTTYVGTWLSDHNMIGATLTLPRESEEGLGKPTKVERVPTTQPSPAVPVS